MEKEVWKEEMKPLLNDDGSIKSMALKMIKEPNEEYWRKRYPLFIGKVTDKTYNLNAVRLQRIWVELDCATYWRDGGEYSVSAHYEGEKLVAIINETHQKYECRPVSYEEWRESNGEFVIKPATDPRGYIANWQWCHVDFAKGESAPLLLEDWGKKYYD